ncbi:MAG: glycoside hydrolase family 97 catalytic domain-containing protein [Phycisphaerae bacterium]|nr:glycoside hydrolase family 97 catalytic domain-containing protein [Phycisphaerae bacterium]
MKFVKILLVVLGLLVCQAAKAEGLEVCRLKSPDGLNAIRIWLNEDGQPFYRVYRREIIFVQDSPMGLRCEGEDFKQGLRLHQIGSEESWHESYRLLAGNRLAVDTRLNRRTLTLKNDKGSLVHIELAAGNEGIGFRCRFEESDALRLIHEELTGFWIPPAAAGWLQPYHAAGRYTPAYEDFYFRVEPGDPPPVSREKPRGWSLPALFQMPSAAGWMLLAESGTDGSYCACHLDADAKLKGLYRIAFAFDDEATGAGRFNPDAKPAPVLTRSTPWRVMIMGDEAKDILQSTLITDLAGPSQIEDASWIEPGRASWSWWSHPERPDTADRYNRFTDLAARFGWEYTLFDAGWWDTDLAAVCRYAHDKGVKPLLWAHAVDFYDARKRRQKLDQWAAAGIRGIKVDFWCSDRQETIAAMLATLKDAAERKLVVNFHGCTIPRGWHRTWPNLLTAEAVLGTECYFFEERYPQKAAELNTILPFTRNVLAPMDVTPVALTMRKFPRKTTAAHELAAALTGGSGIIHYADSDEVFNSFPEGVKQVLKDAPAHWDETICLLGEPGRTVVLARRAGQKWFIAGLNGTAQPRLVTLDLKSLGQFPACIEITEGNENPLMEFSVERITDVSGWEHQVPPYGGFVLESMPAK